MTEIKVDDKYIGDLFSLLQTHKETLNIGHFELAQSPLKDIFESIVS